MTQPTAAHANVPANFDNTVEIKDFSFHFKKDKLGNKRASVELKLPVPSVEGLAAIVNGGGKALDLLMETMYDTVRSQVASLVSDDEKISQDTIDISKITWDYIANMPKADRRSNAIPNEVWEAFGAAYIDQMPGLTGKSQTAVSSAVQVYLKKFSMFKTNKPVLEKLKEQLGLFIENGKDIEQFADILELLTTKVETYLKADEAEQLAANL